MSQLKTLFRRIALALGAEPRDQAPDEAERLALAALLVHVARVDGILSAPERRRLEAMIESRFGMDRKAAVRLVERAEILDGETDDVAGLLTMLGRDVGVRRRFLGMAYSVAQADGEMHEIEANMVWRLGRLLGFDEREIEAIRETQALQSL